MVDKITIAFVLGAVLVLGGLGPNIATMIQTAEGHGVQAVSYTHLTLPTPPYV